MSEIKILHLSDLHYDSSKPDDTQIILDAFLQDLDNFKDIDFIVFSGDLVKAGDKRDDFEKAFKTFIVPLLEKTKLSISDFFIAPGNHDIQRNIIDEIIEDGLKCRLKNRESINAFLDKEYAQDFKHLERLDHFNEFKDRFNTGHTITSNKLFSTHIFKKKKVKIGVTCLNSSWRATGCGSDEKGKLLIGERQIDNALKDIKECNIKIAIFHHALDWLQEYDLGDTKKRLSREFDFLFCGHLHDLNIELVQNFQNKAVLLQGGSLNSGRTYYNGYSVLCFDPQNSNGTVYLHSYYDDRRCFDKALNKCENGIFTFELDWMPPINILIEQLNTFYDQELIETMKASELTYTDEISSLRSMPDNKIKELEEGAYNAYLKNPRLFFTDITSCYFVARQLFKNIKQNDFKGCNYTFIYPIHQYLSEMIRKADEKDEIQDILRNWLEDKHILSTVRDFAAFELGMTRAEIAIDALLKITKNDNEPLPIRNYSAMALGIIMKKNDGRLNDLLKLSFKEKDLEIKKTINNSILFITKYKEEN